MEVYKITEEQKDILIGKTYDGLQYFNPTLDADGNWFISIEEFNYLTLVKAQELNIIVWWFTLPLIEYNPIIYERF
ncbi:hypothetical protein UFOVP516_7 [uncultured Caudovirales phage]|uniref:Uncharacterized protein n=1 Tax=uncultured Caudovirales phage TaxID=2100421 RepID=A0A6J5ML33_9CAUD|nr:hypothetical protein UFOVP516_7 [uncultured Caudovirales phage]